MMPENKISFEGYHLPGLNSGEKKEIKSKLTFESNGIPKVDFPSPDLTIFISGPRFVFSPAEFFAVFPPRDSFGEFDNVLPHIELTPSTLPWQRKSGCSDPTIPWLALILLQDDEWTDESKVEAVKMQWHELRDELGLPEEVTDQPDEKEKHFPPVKVLKIEREFLNKIVPTKDDLKWLSHVRVGHDPHGKEVERAVLVCNRMPRPGARAEVHLVSLEGRFKEDKFDCKKVKSDEKISLLSIYSWQFTCPDEDQFKVSDKAISRLAEPLKAEVENKFPAGEPRDKLYRGKQEFEQALADFNKTEKNKLVNACHIQTETFKGLIDALDLGWAHVPPHAESPNKFIKVGSVPLAHGLRKGGKTVSWYHGPLIADKSLSRAIEKEFLSTLPVGNADHLLLYNQKTGMLDTSYAAAWQLGRLLSVSEPRISQQIAQWKTSHAREAALAEQNLFFSHIPFTDSDFAHKTGGQLEGNLQQYFTDLSLLKDVPFQYLIPHESLLPDESLRFFYVDPLWIECLLDGAFSIGRSTQYDIDREKGEAFLDKVRKGTITGVLLRSDLVSGWPSLTVEAYKTEKIAKEGKLTMLRFERLGPNALIAIFEGEANNFILHLPPESLHFGFSRHIDENGKYFKELKNINDGSELKTQSGKGKTCSVDLGWRSDKSLRIFDSAKLKKNINDNITNHYSDNYKIQHSGQFAIELLEGVPRLKVTVTTTHKKRQ